MANAKKCDRCGKLYENKKTYPYPQIKVVDELSATNQKAYLDLQELDLCFECELSFFDWMMKMQKKAEIEKGEEHGKINHKL